ncbi:ABC transporter ATP-binding protein [Bifidobacterium sp. MA2]|uniref:ABC transporter ATP-binding protein n=1 Tax=Bifidobacterium santillanense TaxID=2809028 RepID=A0ABS5UQS2_9BIFI|nr:dipeptide/oligopeptide/nickel ABC transporter ATP-binding protein [Bifidobacterium santillanense]MBT1173200.1 ABC transporter ATP-binding protein [Bifidobacterium santillanense]
MIDEPTPILELRHITVRYGDFTAVDDVSLALPKGVALGIVGESGAGKSTLARVAAGLIAPTAPGTGSARPGTGSGYRGMGSDRHGVGPDRDPAPRAEILLDGMPIAPIRRTRAQRRRIQMVFQNPDSSLNPSHTVRRILAEGMLLHGTLGPHPSHERVDARCRELLHMVGLGESDGLGTAVAAGFGLGPADLAPRADLDDILDRRPHAFSGGQRQRIAIARALAVEPDVLIADEPTSALDVSVQRDVLDLLATLRRTRGLTLMLITHDLGVVNEICDEVAVMRGGEIVANGPAATFFHSPLAGYSGELLDAARSVALPGGAA